MEIANAKKAYTLNVQLPRLIATRDQQRARLQKKLLDPSILNSNKTQKWADGVQDTRKMTRLGARLRQTKACVEFVVKLNDEIEKLQAIRDHKGN